MYDWIGKITSCPRRLTQMARFCGLFPRTIMLMLCQAIGIVLYYAAGSKLRKRILVNLRELIGRDQMEKQLRTYRLHYFQNIVITLYEILIDSARLKGSECWRFQAEGEARLQQALANGRGAIVYTPHSGNFFYYYWYLCQKYPCLTIATGGSSELRPLYQLFENMGCPGLDYDSMPPLELLRRLKKHLESNGVVFILGDFWRPTFPISSMFGKWTRTPEGAASLSIEQQVPVIPFYGYRNKGFTHKLVFGKPLYLHDRFNRKQRSAANLLLNGFMEQVITRMPAQWFYWFNADERWIDLGVGDEEQSAFKQVN